MSELSILLINLYLTAIIMTIVTYHHAVRILTKDLQIAFPNESYDGNFLSLIRLIIISIIPIYNLIYTIRVVAYYGDIRDGFIKMYKQQEKVLKELVKQIREQNNTYTGE